MVDFKFLKVAFVKYAMDFSCLAIDTLELSRRFHEQLPKKSLEAICRFYEIDQTNQHRAFDDAYVCALLYERIKEVYSETHSQYFIFKELSYCPKKREPMTKKQEKDNLKS